MTYTHLRFYDGARTVQGLLPDHVALQVQHDLNDTNTITFNYPLDGVNANLLLSASVGFIEVVEDGQPDPNWYILEDDGDDLTAALDGSPIQVSARGVMAMLEWAVTYPELHVPGGPVNLLYPQNRFIEQTPGAIMATLLDRAQARGALSYLTYDFTATHDSNGVAWPTTYTQQYDSGLDYLTVFKGMLDNGWADGRTSGFVLQMFVPDVALNVDKPNVVLRKGQQVMEAPIRKRSRRNVRTVILGVGADRVLAEETDATAEAKWTRREGSANDGRALSVGTMQYVTQAALTEVKHEAEAYTLRLAINEPAGEAWFLPERDFTVGDQIRYDQVRANDTTLTPLRVRTITYGWDDSTSAKTCVLELNDKWTELAILLKARVDTLLNGISQAPLGNPPPVPLPNPTPPSYPGSVIAVLGVTDGPGGVKLNAATVTWPPVDLKQDGLPYNDAAYYAVSYKQDSVADATGSWSAEQQVTGTSATFNGLTPGLPYVFRVRAVDLSGNHGDWTYSLVETGDASSGPAAAPSTPTVSDVGGAVLVQWDGLDAAGHAMPADTGRVEIQVATASSGPWTTFYTAFGAGTVSTRYTPPAYNVPYYFQLLAHNYGPTATASASASITPVPLTASVLQQALNYNNFTFSDAGNLLGDGSFETSAGRAAFTLPTGASFVNAGTSAFLGSYVLRFAPGARTLVLASISCVAGQEYLIRRAVKGSGGANGVFQVIVTYYDRTGTALSQPTVLATPTSDGTWYAQVSAAGAVVVPANAVRMDVAVQSDAAFTTGTWDSDAYEVRYKVDTLLIRNAAITNALIADATIDKAKIASLDAGMISSTLVAAGSVVAGIVDATTITGAQLIATGTQGDILAYNGTPALGNLILTISPRSGTDAYGNSYPSGVMISNGNASFLSLVTSNTNSDAKVFAWNSSSVPTLSIQGPGIGGNSAAVNLSAPRPPYSTESVCSMGGDRVQFGNDGTVLTNVTNFQFGTGPKGMYVAQNISFSQASVPDATFTTILNPGASVTHQNNDYPNTTVLWSSNSFQPPANGYYDFTLYLHGPGTATRRTALIRKNGSTVAQNDTSVSTDVTVAVGWLWLTTSDSVDFRIRQDSGASQTCTGLITVGRRL